MFRTRIAPRFALGIAAAAISLTSLMSAVAPASADPLFKPDLQVKYKGENGVGAAHMYQFEVKNIGGADAQQVSTFATVYRATNDIWAVTPQNVSFTVGTIPQGATKIVTVACNDHPVSGYGSKCVGVKASVVAPDELDNSNNTASHGNIG